MSQVVGDDFTPPRGNAKGKSVHKPLFPNPFYVILLLSSTVFVLTALLYCVSPYVVARDIKAAGPAPGGGSRALVGWLDEHGPLTLAIEFIVMLVSGCLAMATDHWFTAKPTAQKAQPHP